MYTTEEMHDKRPLMSENPWVGKIKPFKIIGNTYFCGTYQGSSHLIDTGDGLIMIDPGYANTAYLVVDSIYKLGFKPEDIKYIVCSHWHGDHTAAVPHIVSLSGAKTLIHRDDAEKGSKYFTPDVLIEDGDTLTLGNVTMTFIHTPGHTKGTVSPFWYTTEGGKTYRLGMFGGAGVNTMATGRFDFEGCREAYRASVNRLRAEKVDVFIGNHVWNNDTYGKGMRLLAGGENEFIDGELWGKFLDGCEERLDGVIAKEKAAGIGG